MLSAQVDGSRVHTEQDSLVSLFAQNIGMRMVRIVALVDFALLKHRTDCQEFNMGFIILKVELSTSRRDFSCLS